MNKYSISKNLVMRIEECTDKLYQPKIYTFQILKCRNNPGLEVSNDGKAFRRFKVGYSPDRGDLIMVPNPWVSTTTIERGEKIYEFESDEEALLFSEVME